MTSTDWRDELGALDRFRNVQKMSELRSIDQHEAFKLETAAFENSESKEAYEAECQAEPSSPSTAGPSYYEDESDTLKTGIQIGSMPDCIPIGTGITSTVYRSGTSALKVIESPSLPPHNAQREIKFLRALYPPCIPLLSVFYDISQQLVLEFPFMPYTLASVLSSHTQRNMPVSQPILRAILRDVLTALAAVHSQGIIHRDIKPSSILLASPTGPAVLADFSSSWQDGVNMDEPLDGKILDIGTGPWRAPEALFGNKQYSTSLDMWAFGTIVVESARNPPSTLFTSPAANEDGNQLGLILSIFKTLGTPTREMWPEAISFKTPPFDIYAVFEGESRDDIFAGIEGDLREVVENLVVYESSRRWTAQKTLQHRAFIKK
ncbi:Cyclin-dependent kinase B2-1 [Ceratocystis lukuohia]|uniref:cyclin-dependent kinase n=1 Tax=Ceratocystis lukuohia TaxID=2019550 RepID=A0ABR4MTK9_9PEZI